MGKMRFSRWNILTVLAFAVICFTTFQPIIQATIVHPSIGGSIFDITSYVSGLATLYVPWLPLMMSQGSGERTSWLLSLSQIALYVLCVLAILALVLVLLGLVLNGTGKRKAARIVGIAGFICAIVVPVVSIVLVNVVQMEMQSSIISIAILGVRSVVYGQIVAAAIGVVSVVFATRIVADPKQRRDDHGSRAYAVEV